MTPEQIKKGRGALGLNQNDLAELIGVKRVTVCSWENGHKPPRAKNVAKMQELFSRKWRVLELEEIENAAKPYLNKEGHVWAWGLFAFEIEAICRKKNI